MGDINRMVELYLALQPIPTGLIADAIVDTQSQHNLIEQTIRNPHLIAFPPASEYQRRFWKNVIAVLEEKNMEIEDEIYEYLISTLSVPVRQGPPEASYLTYLLRRPEFGTISSEVWRRSAGIDNFSQDQRPLTILESRTTIERGTTGLRTWRASLDLAEWILGNDHVVSSTRILELGSGAGLLGLLVATIQQLARLNVNSSHCLKKKAPCIYMTDVDDAVLMRCAYNLRLACNMLDESPNVYVRALDWTDSVDPNRQAHVQSLLEEIDADVILAADVVYDLSIIPPLTRTLRLALERPLPEGQSSQRDASNSLLQPRDSRVAYVALTLRREQSFTEFLTTAERDGLAVDFVDMVLPPHGERVFRGSDDSASRGTGGTKLLRLTAAGAE